MKDNIRMVVEVLLLIIITVVGYIGKDVVEVSRDNSQKLTVVETKLDAVILTQTNYNKVLADHLQISGHAVMVERVRHLESKIP